MTDSPKWVVGNVRNPVVTTQERAERVAHEDALRANPRGEGEDVNDWLARVSAAAVEILTARGLPYVEREPGSDDL